MPDKARSFTATLSVDGEPITFLQEAADREVLLASRCGASSHEAVINASRALGTLPGPDEAWAHERDLGLVDFHVVEAKPVLLYFRHASGGYRLYVRSGSQFGQGVFNTASGLLEAQPITTTDPTLWQLEDVDTGLPLDFSDNTGATFKARLALASDGAPVALFGIHTCGGYLAVAPDRQPVTLDVSLVEREADWLG